VHEEEAYTSKSCEKEELIVECAEVDDAPTGKPKSIHYLKESYLRFSNLEPEIFDVD